MQKELSKKSMLRPAAKKLIVLIGMGFLISSLAYSVILAESQDILYIRIGNMSWGGQKSNITTLGPEYATSTPFTLNLTIFDSENPLETRGKITNYLAAPEDVQKTTKIPAFRFLESEAPKMLCRARSLFYPSSNNSNVPLLA